MLFLPHSLPASGDGGSRLQPWRPLGASQSNVLTPLAAGGRQSPGSHDLMRSRPTSVVVRPSIHLTIPIFSAIGPIFGLITAIGVPVLVFLLPHPRVIFLSCSDLLDEHGRGAPCTRQGSHCRREILHVDGEESREVDEDCREQARNRPKGGKKWELSD